MRRMLLTLTTLILGLGFLPSAARADWGVAVAIDLGGGRLHGTVHRTHRARCRPVHVHRPAPVYQQVWVPPVYARVVVGYSVLGCPIWRTVMVQAGYYASVIIGYRCGGCGAACNP